MPKPPDRRFDDLPFSGLPPRPSRRRGALGAEPAPPPRRGSPAPSGSFPVPPRRDSRPGPGRDLSGDPTGTGSYRPAREDARVPLDDPRDPHPFRGTNRRPTPRRDDGDDLQDREAPRSRGGRQRPAADGPAPRSRGDGYGDTHADLRWDTDRRLRPAYRDGRAYLPDDEDAPRRETRRPAPPDPFDARGRARGRFDGSPDPLRQPRGRSGDAPGRGRPPVPREDAWPDLPDDEPAYVAAAGDHRGPGGRMLAIAGVAFLVMSIAVASIGSMLTDRESSGTEIAAVATDALGAPVDPTATVDDGPLVRFEDQPIPTSTLPPAGQLERGFEGQWLDDVPTVCIDPGHGGWDRGRTFAGDGNIPALEEATFVLDQSLRLQEILRDRGYVVVMTRTSDQAVNADDVDTNGDGLTSADGERARTYDEIQARIDICNRANADVMISVHINGYDTGRPHGFEAWYTADRPFGTQSGILAQLGVEELESGMAEVGYTPENRGAKDDGTYSVDDSDPTLAHNMLLTGPELPGELRPSMMPGAIMESLFITNLDDIAFLLSSDSTDIIAGAYADAIDGYFSRFEA